MRTGVKKCKRSILFSPWSAAVRTNPMKFAGGHLVPAKIDHDAKNLRSSDSKPFRLRLSNGGLIQFAPDRDRSPKRLSAADLRRKPIDKRDSH
jgi:hypothetical protein